MYKIINWGCDDMKEIHITDKAIIYNDMEYGWIRGKTQPSWHHKVYNMWRDMWRRVYSEVHWFGSLIHPSFKYLSNYVKWIEEQPRFEEFCSTCDKIRWSIDKDSKHICNRDYYPEYITLMTQSENSIETINRNGNPFLKEDVIRKRMKQVIGIPLDNTNKIILTVSRNDVSKYGFQPSNVSMCLNKKLKSHKGYKWFRVNYKHDKVYRVK